MPSPLPWLAGLSNSLGLALCSGVTFSVEETIDPLKKKVTLHLAEELEKGDYQPLQRIVHGFARANDCVVHRIRREPRKLILEVLTKTRLGGGSNKNPLAE